MLRISKRGQPKADIGVVIQHTAKADCYNLLALLLQAPTEETTHSFLHETLIEDCSTILDELDIDIPSIDACVQRFIDSRYELASSKEALGTLRIEYTRLFGHPSKARIEQYEGIFVDKECIRKSKDSTQALLFVNPQARDAERHYREAGLTVYDKNSTPADRITTELQFLAHLHTIIAQTVFHDDKAGERRVRKLIGNFHAQHTSIWIPRFFERCARESIKAFYQATGQLGLCLMHAEALTPDSCFADSL